jgi:hypothetical protein
MRFSDIFRQCRREVTFRTLADTFPKTLYNIGRDVIFEEDLAFRRSQETTPGGEEQEAPKVEESTDPSSIEEPPSYHEGELEEFVDLVDPPSDEDTRPRWLRDTFVIVQFVLAQSQRQVDT